MGLSLTHLVTQAVHYTHVENECNVIVLVKMGVIRSLLFEQVVAFLCIHHSAFSKANFSTRKGKWCEMII